MFNVGDMVTPKHSLKDYQRYGDNVFVPQMRKCVWKFWIVEKIDYRTQYSLKDDTSNCSWTDEMLNKVETNIK